MIISKTNAAISTTRTQYSRSIPRKELAALDKTVTLFDRIQALTTPHAAALWSSAIVRRRRLLQAHAAPGSGSAELVRIVDPPSCPLPDRFLIASTLAT
jgi:hypothetical protein